MPPRLRHGVRALIVDAERRTLLCRFDLPDKGLVVWASPGGGVESGESLLQALRRELAEEVGLRLDNDPPHVWHQVVEDPTHLNGYDGIIRDYFLVLTRHFSPQGSFTAQQLAAENVSEFRWWPLAELQAYRGDDLFAPRKLPHLLHELLDHGVPEEPLALAL